MSKKNALTRTKMRQAFACVQTDRIGEALHLYQKICETDPMDAESWFMAGTLYGRMGRVAEAEAALRKRRWACSPTLPWPISISVKPWNCRAGSPKLRNAFGAQ